MALGTARSLATAAVGALALTLVACGSPAGSDASPTSTAPTGPMGTTAPVEPTTDAPDCPPPPADSPTGAVDDPFTIGDQIVVECFTVVVDAVDRDALPIVTAENPGAAPSDGNVFMTVTVTITRSGGAPADASDVEVVLAGSMTTSGQPDPDLVVPPGPPAGMLEVGEYTSGTYVYEVSGGASVSVEIAVGAMTPLSVLPY